MKEIIIYQGKYGATKQYAVWLGQELNLPVKSAENIGKEQLKGYDTLLIGTSVYIGKLQIKKWLKSNLAFVRDKKIFLFQVAGTPPDQKEKRQAYNLAGIPKEIINNCEFYFLPGRMNMQKLSRIDRFMLKMGARLAKNIADKTTMLTNYDNVKKENLGEMLTAVKKYIPVERQGVHNKDAVYQF